MANYELIALNRDSAKQLFASRTPAALRAFVAGLSDNANLPRLVLDQAVALHRALCGGESPADGEYPFNHVVLGGRELADEDGLLVVLKRPDMAGHIAAALAEVKLESPELTEICGEVSAFYQAAATDGCAVILVRTSNQKD